MADQINQHVHEFMSFYTGLDTTYGMHKPVKDKPKGNNWFSNDPPVWDTYYNHLIGKQRIGIVPINKKNSVKFTAIDVDIYDDELLKPYTDAIEQHNFPIVIHKSKNGGNHLFMYYNDWVHASKARSICYNIAKILGLKILARDNYKDKRGLEVFPKSAQLSENGKSNFICLPYFNALNTDTPAIEKGKKLTLSTAIKLIKSKVRSIEEIESFIKDLPFSDAPLFLQTPYLLNNLREGDCRNNFTFQSGLYLKKKHPDSWDVRLQEINDSRIAPLSAKEFNNIIESLRTTNATYNPTLAPMCNYYDKEDSGQREFDIGKNDGYFFNIDCGRFISVGNSELYYKLEVRKMGSIDNYKWVVFNGSKDFDTQLPFRRKCLDAVGEVINKLKAIEWDKLVRSWFERVEHYRVDPAFDFSKEGVFNRHFAAFIFNHTRAKEKWQVTNGYVYHHNYKYKGAQRNRYWFDLQGLERYITEKMTIEPSEIHIFLDKLDCVSNERLRIDGDLVSLYYITEDNITKHLSYARDNSPIREVNFVVKKDEEDKDNSNAEEPTDEEVEKQLADAFNAEEDKSNYILANPHEDKPF